ncbi:Conserved_hypothetical protein [Hexamita inflata]|uniref:Uncharacterized protein n=1 Tax=Hexamita inflata TaxID=28002 RepID=A0AA86PEA6_9EUKA|nr:Conserved hypothetical protein [Hexamita inflata]
MLSERIDWYTACANNDLEYVTERLQQDSQIFKAAADATFEYEAARTQARTLGTAAPLMPPHVERTAFLNRSDDRLTDLTKNVVSGFTGLLYAAYFDSLEVFQALFEYEYKRSSLYEFNMHVAADTKTTRLILPIGSDCLQVALLRSSRRCLEYIILQIRGQDEIRDYFYSHKNQDGHNALSVAALCSTNINCSNFITEEVIDKSILENAELKTGFFYICCYFGQYTALEKIFAILESEEADEALKQKIYTAALIYQGDVSLLDACQKKIDYHSFVSSNDLKVQCYNMMAQILQDALICLIDYKGTLYKNLRERWSISGLKYYKLIENEDPDRDVESYEEVPIKYVEPLDIRLAKWFSCKDLPFIKNELNTLRRQSDLRPLDYDLQIYPRFMLIHYALLNDNPQVFEQIYEHEFQIGIQEDTLLRLSNQKVLLKKGTKVMQMAVTVNAVKCIQLFNQKTSANAWRYLKEINEDRESLIMVTCRVKNEASRLIWDCYSVINEELDHIDEQDSKLNVFKYAIEFDNVYVLDKLVQLAGNSTYTPIIFLIVLAFKNQDTNGFDSGTIAKYLTRIALAYVQKAPADDVEKMMTQFLTPKEWAEKKKHWDLLQQCILQQFPDADTPEQEAQQQQERLDLILKQAEQQLYCLLQYQSLIFNNREENVPENDQDENPKKTVWFDYCFGAQSLTPIRVLAPMCLKYRDPRRTDLESQLSFRGFTGLMYALMGCNTQVIEYLLNYEFMECLQQDEQIPTRYGTFLLKKGATPYHMACCVLDEKMDLQFRIVQNFYRKHKEFEWDCQQTITGLSIIFGKTVDQTQFEKDLLIDKDLLRYAIQNMSLEFVQRITKYYDNKRFKQAVIQNYVNVFEFNFEYVNVFDIAVEMYYANLDETTIQIKDTVRKTLTKLLRENPESAGVWFCTPFARLPDEDDTAAEQRKQAKTQEISAEIQVLCGVNPLMTVDESVIINEKFSIVEEEELLNLSKRTQDVSKYNLNEQSEIQSDWFNACRGGQMELVRKVSYVYKGAQDKRQTDIVAMNHQGMSGLMYACAYGQREVFSHLVQEEMNVFTTSPSIFQHKGKYFYVPIGSNVLHIAVLVQNELFITKIMQNAPHLFNHYNSYRITPFHLMCQRGYMMDIFFAEFIKNATRYHFDKAVKCGFQASNTELITHLVKNRKSKLQELVYQLTFQVSKGFKSGELKQESNEAEYVLLEIEDEATEFAFEKTTEFERELDLGNSNLNTCLWKDLLKEKFQAEYETAYKEYIDCKQFKELGQVVFEEEKIIQNNNVVNKDEYIVLAPKKTILLTKQEKQKLEWFDACKNGVVETVAEMAPHFIRTTDSRFNNVLEDEYTGFTGLMYAVFEDQVEVVKLLLLDEGRVRTQQKNVINAWSKAVRKNGTDEHYRYLCNRNLGIAQLILLRGSVNTFMQIFDYEQRFQNYYQDERVQLALNQLCREIREELYQESCTSLYHQMRFDVGEGNPVFLELFNNQLRINGENQIILGTQFKNRVFAVDLFQQLEIEFNKMMAIQYQLEYDDLTKQRKYDEIKSIPTLQIVFDVLEQYTKASESFEGHEFEQLLNKCIEIGISRHELPRMYRLCTRVLQKRFLSKEAAMHDLDDRIQSFLMDKYKSDLIVPDQTRALLNSAYIVELEWLTPQTDDYQPNDWFDACANGNLNFIKMYYDMFNRKVDDRPFNLEKQVYPGFSGIHYAALNNQVEVIKLLFEAEGNMLTEEDAVVLAHGIGFDLKFLLSAGSNLLHICAICDQPEAFEVVHESVMKRNLHNLYMRSNARGINNLFISSICWRYKTGQMLFNSTLTQKLIWKAFQTDFTLCPTHSPINIIAQTRSVHLAHYLQAQTQNSEFKNKLYEMVLKHNMPKIFRDEQKILICSPIEQKYIEGWFNGILEDAIVYGIENISEINWSLGLKNCLGRNMDLVLKQYQRYQVVISNRCEIEIDELIKQEYLLSVNQTQYSRQNMSATGQNRSLTMSVLNTSIKEMPEPPQKKFLKKDELMSKTKQIMDRVEEVKARSKWSALEDDYQKIVVGKDQE